MSTHDDENIEFDFFDEPETVEATQRTRRGPRRDRGGDGGGTGDGPRKPPRGAPTGLIPLARLVGLIAIAIVVVVALVFWVGACQGKSKQDDYAAYAAKVRTIAQSSEQLGREFANKLAAPGLKEADLETSLQQYAQQEQQAYTQAQQIRPPGPLRQIHQQAVDAIELRAKGLAGLGDAVSRTASAKEASVAAQALAAQAQLLVASDVVWDELYRLPATLQLKTQGVTGVVIPDSNFVTNVELVSSRSFSVVFQKLHGPSTGGTPSGKHGNGLVGVKVQPQGIDLSTGTASTVQVSADLSFVATVENSGDFQEVNVPVTLTIDAGGTPIVRRQSISVIQPAEQKQVTFSKFDLPNSAFGARATVKVEVGAVAGEINTDNNSATYTVFFTLSSG
jgi:hypothetical protein